jgi:hypothetical protein
MLRRTVDKILNVIESIIHVIDALTLSPSPLNKFGSFSRPFVDPKTVPYRSRPWDPYRRPWNG